MTSRRSPPTGLVQPKVSRGNRRPTCDRHGLASQECKALNTDEPRCHRPRGSFARLQVPRPWYLATVERVPPPKPGRK